MGYDRWQDKEVHLYVGGGTTKFAYVWEVGLQGLPVYGR